MDERQIMKIFKELHDQNEKLLRILKKLNKTAKMFEKELKKDGFYNKKSETPKCELCGEPLEHGSMYGRQCYSCYMRYLNDCNAGRII